jgi:hypothetical protein
MLSQQSDPSFVSAALGRLHSRFLDSIFLLATLIATLKTFHIAFTVSPILKAALENGSMACSQFVLLYVLLRCISCPSGTFLVI